MEFFVYLFDNEYLFGLSQHKQIRENFPAKFPAAINHVERELHDYHGSYFEEQNNISKPLANGKFLMC